MEEKKVSIAGIVFACLCVLLAVLLTIALVSRNSLQRWINELNTQISDKDSTIAGLQGQQAVQAQSLQELEAAQAEKDQQISSLQEQNSAQAAQIDTLNGTIETLRTSGNDQEATLSALEAEAAKSRVYESLTADLKACLEEAAAQSALVSINEQGHIVIDTATYFKTASADMNEFDYSELAAIASGLYRFLSDPAHAQQVGTVLFSSYTDDTGTDHANRLLTTKRAVAVMELVLDANKGALKEFSDYFAAAGYGTAQPSADNGTEEGRIANRRVEISLIPKIG